ncbi:MAG: DUF2779 domain-containing protein [Candidatus Taylorbacteria bacterium]|nr:DUF2779 domain-containing protein [Candidatus Taylorbacteria bacterium]
MIIESGNEVDTLARGLFPNGILVEDKDDTKLTKNLIEKRTPIIYQPVFETSKFKMISDIFVWNGDVGAYDVYEVKASNSGENKKQKDEIYANDLAFQYVVLKENNIPINKLYLVRLNKEYVRGVELDLNGLLTKEDFTEKVKNIIEVVGSDMDTAFDIVFQKEEPYGECKCMTRGRSSHCTTFKYSNPNVPEYSVHDIARIGLSKKKLEDLIDSQIFSILDVPDDYKLSDIQKNQVQVAQMDKKLIDRNLIKEFLATIIYPISFFDYETFPSAIPRFSGYSPFNQIPFQFSLHITSSEDVEPRHGEFIFSNATKPDIEFIEALQKQLPTSGSIIVWNKSFEMGINSKLAERNPEYKGFLENLNSRVIDLEDVFKQQLYVHKGFKGKTSIKLVLPTLVPALTYKELNIQNGAVASDTWNKIVTGGFSESEKNAQIENLLVYCGLDTYAMYAIWKHLIDLE